MIITDPLRIVELSYLSILFLLLLRIEAYPVLLNCAVFKGKHLCWSHFLIKLQTCRPATLLKRNTNTGVFCNIVKFFRIAFL